MKKSIVILICCMFFVQLHAQQNPTTLSTPEQDSTIVNIEVSQDVESISEYSSDVIKKLDPLSSEDMIMDTIPIAEIDTTQSPIHQEVETAPPSDEEEDNEEEEEEEEEFFIVELDDFQTVQPTVQKTERKHNFLSFWLSLFKKKNERKKEIINTKTII